MQKTRSFISMLMLALLLFPMVEKAMHEFGHLDEEHCGVKETHFCHVEHNCSICNYHFSSSLTPPRNTISIEIVVTPTNSSIIEFVSNTTASPKYTFSLRGPPIA
jgi:hypothetical protein